MPRTTRISGTPKPPPQPKFDRPFQFQKIDEVNKAAEEFKMIEQYKAEERAMDHAGAHKRIMGLVARKRRTRRK